MVSRSSIYLHEPGRLQRADQPGQPRAGGVVGGRERRPVRQPRLRPHDVRLAAGAPVRDRDDPAHLPPPLPRGGGEVGGADAHWSGTGAMPALGWSASLTDCHTWPYQGAFGSASRRGDHRGRGRFRHLGRGVDDAVGPVTDLDELQPLARLLLDVGRVGPPGLLPLQVGDALLLLDDLALQRGDLAALPQQRAGGRGQRDRQDDEDGQEDRPAHPGRAAPLLDRDGGPPARGGAAGREPVGRRSGGLRRSLRGSGTRAPQRGWELRAAA